MSTEQLKESLKKLHESIRNTEQVDVELMQLLTELNQDIQQLLAKEHPEPDALGQLGDRSLELSAKFAAQNPHLESGLRELNNILVSMGI